MTTLAAQTGNRVAEYQSRATRVSLGRSGSEFNNVSKSRSLRRRSRNQRLGRRWREDYKVRNRKGRKCWVPRVGTPTCVETRCSRMSRSTDHVAPKTLNQPRFRRCNRLDGGGVSPRRDRDLEAVSNRDKNAFKWFGAVSLWKFRPRELLLIKAVKHLFSTFILSSVYVAESFS